MTQAEDIKAIARGLRDLPQAVERLKQEIEAIKGIDRERTDEMSGHLDTLQDILADVKSNLARIDTNLAQNNYTSILILDALINNKKQRPGETKRLTNELRENVIPERIASFKVQLKKHYDNLNYYEEQSAGYGPVPPVSIINSINDEKTHIHRLEGLIRDLQNI